VPIELSTDLPTPLIPLAWLIGKWAGAGVIGYPTIEEARFGQEVEFSHDGRPFLFYRSRTWLLDDDGNEVRPLATESGYWRPVAATVGHADEDDAEPADAEPGDEAAPSAADPSPGTELEVLLAHPTGFVEIYLGTVRGPRIDLATDLVARTSTAKEYTAATRLYGLVESDLLWAMDMAAMGQPLQSHASARLKRL
jgi:THAP4-like, heme-binding beta-barrel domain